MYCTLELVWVMLPCNTVNFIKVLSRVIERERRREREGERVRGRVRGGGGERTFVKLCSNKS